MPPPGAQNPPMPYADMHYSLFVLGLDLMCWRGVCATPWYLICQLFCRPALLADEAFQVKNDDGAIVGVRMICPHCKCNDYTAVGARNKVWF